MLQDEFEKQKQELIDNYNKQKAELLFRLKVDATFCVIITVLILVGYGALKLFNWLLY